VKSGYRFAFAFCLCVVVVFSVRVSMPAADDVPMPTVPTPVAAPATGLAPAGSSPDAEASKTPAGERGSTKADDIDRLLASGKPEDAFTAYNLIHACLRARSIETELPSAASPETRQWMEQEPKPGEACGNITPGQIVSRAQFAERAAQAGVRGAAMAYLMEGPRGDLALNMQAQPDDPVIAEWMQRSRAYVREAAERGELQAIGNMSNYYQFDQIDHAESLRYFVAQMEIMKPTLTPERQRSFDQIVALLSKNLSSEEIAAATEAGKRLVDRCCRGTRAAPAQ
jgi:hypothetical protein